MSEYGDEEGTEVNDESEQEQQENDERSNSNEFEGLEDFEPTYKTEFENEIENFEPTHEIDLEELYENFKLTNEIDSDQLYNDFKPSLDKNQFETSGLERPNEYIISTIESIKNNPFLSTDEKIEALNKKFDQVWKNSNLSQEEKRQFEGVIKGAITEIEAATGRAFTSGNNTSEKSTSNTENIKNISENDLSNQKEAISDPTEENHLFSKIKKEKTPETYEPEIYKNLLEERIQNTFREYHDEKGKFPNYGKNLKKDFIAWVENKGYNPEIIKNVSNIQNNQEITNFLKDKIQNSSLNQTEIANKINETGLSVNRKTVGNYALKEVFNGNKVEYDKRFDKSLDSALKERIINRINKEVEKFTSGVQYDSLYKIAKDFPEVSQRTIGRIAKNEVSQDIYGNMWPSTSGTVSPETKTRIKETLREEAQKGTPRSLRNISEDFPDVSTYTVSDLAKEMYPEKYKEYWPAIKKIPNEMKNEITATIIEEAQKVNPRTLREIHREFPEVGGDSIKRIAKQVIPKDLHDKIWPPLTTEIPKEIASKITKFLKDETNKPKPRSLNEIGRFFSVSQEYVRQLAKKTISKQVYEDTWKGHEPITNDIKNDIIKDIVHTKLNISEIAEKNGVSPSSVSSISQRAVFQDNIDAHRERFPIDRNLEIGNYSHLNLNSLLTRAIKNISNQKYYAEPNIYSDNRRPDGLILEDNKYLHQRLTNPQTGVYLRDKLELDPKNLDHINSTQFDFTNDINIENLLNKIEKYQSKDTLLIIVGTRWYLYNDIKHLPVDDKIKYPENVRVISHNLGAELLGLKGEDKSLYNKIIDSNYNHDLDSLKALYNYDLSSINIHNTEELKNDLIQKGLIKKDFSEYFNFELLNKKDEKEKQLDLDHFLNG